MTLTVPQLMTELAAHAAHLRETVLRPLPHSVAANLRSHPANEEMARRYFANLHAQDWQPRGGYPGSDTHWPVLCMRCGWEGDMFNSHMRRNRRHKGCPKPGGGLWGIVGTVKAAAYLSAPDSPVRLAAFHVAHALEPEPGTEEHWIQLDLAAEYLREARQVTPAEPTARTTAANALTAP